ncbi:MAG: AAA family ATPase [Rhodospirillaceae bacterium]
MINGEHIEQFKRAIADAGLTPPDTIEPTNGRPRRFSTNGKRFDDSGWYVFHADDRPAGAFGDWRTGISGTWSAKAERQFSRAERAAFAKRVAEARASAEEQRRAETEQARQQSAEIWKQCGPVPSHAYLDAKDVKAHGIRLYSGSLSLNGMNCGGSLVIPLRDLSGVIHSLEFVSPTGDKRFLTRGAKTGHYHGIGKPSGCIVVCEGYATGASIHEATGHAVAVAFDAGNLVPVARALRAKYADLEIILAADNDQWTEGNPGVTKATEAARAVGGKLAVPHFADGLGKLTDFNDLARVAGAGAIKHAIANAAPVEQTLDEPLRPVVSLIRGGDITPEPIRWLWDGWLARGKLHILAGSPGTGKTTIAVALAATVTLGGRWPDGTKAGAANVLIWSGEDDPKDTLLPRLIAQGADRDKVFFVGDVNADGGPRCFDPAKDVQALVAEAVRIGDIGLLIVDPVVNAVAGDSHKNTEVRRALQPLVELGTKLDAAVLGISHFSKGTAGRDPVERVTGSIAFGALARIVLATAKTEDEQGQRRLFARAKSNIGPDGGGFDYAIEQLQLSDYAEITASRILWGGVLEGSARELLATAEAEDDPDEKSAAEDAGAWLKDRLSGGPFPAKEVIRDGEAQGYHKRAIQRARQRIGATVKRDGFGPGARVLWTLAIDDKSSIGDIDASLRSLSPMSSMDEIGPDGEVTI